MRRRLIVVGAVVVVGLAAVVVADRLLSGSAQTPTTTPPVVATTTIQRTDVSQTTSDDGTVGYASGYTIDEPSGTTVAAMTQAQQQLATAQGNVAADQQAITDTNAANAQDSAGAQQSLSAAQATASADAATVRTDQAALEAAEQKEGADCQGNAAAGSGGGGGGSTGGNASQSPCQADASSVAADQKAVQADQQKTQSDATQVNAAQAQVASAQQKADQSNHQAQAKLANDQTALANAQAAAAQGQDSASGYDQTSRYTALPSAGQVISPGQVLWAVDGHPVPLLPGTLTPWRAFAPGMTAGPDVATLNQALISLGFGDGVTSSDQFTAATAAAVGRFEASVGMPQTDALPLGAAVFAPTPLRVTTVHPAVGAAVQGGAPVLDVTSTTAVVNVALPVAQAYLVKVGDAVSVTLPDGSNADGTITKVGTVATSTTSNNSPGDNQPQATVGVTVSLAHASPSGSLDQAPVTVNITNAVANQVLAVPTTALLALAGGGYAVEVVDPNGAHRLVGVTTGLFDDQSGLVQVTGAGLEAGQTVVNAA